MRQLQKLLLRDAKVFGAQGSYGRRITELEARLNRDCP
jgi:hypothetical protein